MIKKLVCLIVLLCVFITISVPAQASYFVTAQRSDAAAYVDGKQVVFPAYDISGSRYVRIRDIAHALSGSPKQFDVQWNSAQGAIMLTSGRQYKPVGSEMAWNGENAVIAKASQAKTFIDGEEAFVCVYSIDGVNFYKMRDIARVIDFRLTWDASRKAINIDTSKKSSEPAFSPDDFRPWMRDIDPSKPMVALTFDDGPSTHTVSILNTLEKHNAKATFFVPGTRVSPYSQTILRAFNMGCEIGSHAWSHQLLTTVADSRIRTEIEDSNKAISAVTGVPTTLLRPPYGAENSRVRSVAKDMGVPMIMWSIDTRDWENLNANTVYNNVMRNVKNGDIILFHDTYASTASAVARIVPELIARGYQLVTVSELMYYSGVTLKAGGVYSRGG